MYLQCVPCAHTITFELTCALVLLGTHVLWDGQPCALKCEQCKKDSKAYIERVGGSEQGFEHGHSLSLLC